MAHTNESQNPNEKLQAEKATFNEGIAEMTRGRTEVDPVGTELTGCRFVFAQWAALEDYATRRASVEQCEDFSVGLLLTNSSSKADEKSNSYLLSAGFDDIEREPLDQLVERLSAVTNKDTAPTAFGAVGQNIRSRTIVSMLSLNTELARLPENDELGTLRAINRTTIQLARISGGEDPALTPLIDAEISGVGLSVGQVESVLLQNTLIRHSELVSECFGKAYTSIVELRALAMVGYFDIKQVAAFCRELGLTNTALELSKENGRPDALQMIPRTNDFRINQ